MPQQAVQLLHPGLSIHSGVGPLWRTQWRMQRCTLRRMQWRPQCRTGGRTQRGTQWRVLRRQLRSNRGARKGTEQRGVPGNLLDVAPQTPRGDPGGHPTRRPLQVQGPGGGAAWQTNARRGKVHRSFAESGAVPTRTTTTRGRRERTIIHKASGGGPGLVHPVHNARPYAPTPSPLQAGERINHLPAGSRRNPDRSTACNLRDSRFTAGARRGTAPPWVVDGWRRLGSEEGRTWRTPLGHGAGGAPPWVGDGRRRLGPGEGRGWRAPLSHGAGRAVPVLPLTDAALEST